MGEVRPGVGMTILDGDPTSGWFRKRALLEAVVESIVASYMLSRSPAVRSYIKRMSDATGLPEAEVARSRPVLKYVERLTGLKLSSYDDSAHSL